MKEEARSLREGTEYAIVGDEPVLGLFESGWVALCGPERFFVDMLADKPFIHAFFEKVSELQIRLYRNYLAEVGEYVDVVMVSDDLGTTRGPLVSPGLYRELVKPYQRKLWKSIMESTGAHLFLHSCGSIYRFLPDFIDMGVDIINPVQVSAAEMDTKRLKAEFGERITFWGGIDTRHVLPFGTPDDVEREARRRICDLGPGGGYVLTAVHNIQKGVSPRNICRLYEAARKHGRYPIKGSRSPGPP